jgi:1-acyl-sn-glycerol-3-phosphate acyltransferase
MGVPILPLALTGTRPALPKRGFLFGRSEAEVRVLEPVETTGLTTKDVPALRDMVRARIVAARDTLRHIEPPGNHH